MTTAGVTIDLGTGRATVGDRVLDVTPAGEGLSVGALVVRPLTFGERLRVVTSAADPAALATAVLRVAAARGEPPADAAVEALALHLAGARLDAEPLAFADALSTVTRVYGWTATDVTEAHADLIDRLAQQATRPDDGWTHIVLATSASPEVTPDAAAIRDGLAADLLRRGTGGGVAESGTAGSGANAPGTAAPGTGGSGVAGPGVTGSGTGDLGVGGSGVAGSVAGGPGVVGSGVVGSVAGGPRVGGSGAAGSLAGGPGVGGSGVVGSVAGGPGVGGSGVVGAIATSSGVAGSGVVGSVAGGPGVVGSGVVRSVAGSPGTGGSGAGAVGPGRPSPEAWRGGIGPELVRGIAEPGHVSDRAVLGQAAAAVLGYPDVTGSASVLKDAFVTPSLTKASFSTPASEPAAAEPGTVPEAAIASAVNVATDSDLPAAATFSVFSATDFAADRGTQAAVGWPAAVRSRAVAPVAVPTVAPIAEQSIMDVADRLAALLDDEADLRGVMR